MALLTLLTDFGTRDSYVAVMKGTIAQIDPTLQVIDLTHEIAPQDIASARFCLSSAYPYFPVGTVHIGVVDPGVGSRRRAIALQLENEFLDDENARKRAPETFEWITQNMDKRR